MRFRKACNRPIERFFPGNQLRTRTTRRTPRKAKRHACTAPISIHSTPAHGKGPKSCLDKSSHLSDKSSHQLPSHRRSRVESAQRRVVPYRFTSRIELAPLVDIPEGLLSSAFRQCSREKSSRFIEERRCPPPDGARLENCFRDRQGAGSQSKHAPSVA